MNWKDVTGYEGIYQVSSCGQVRSLDRIDYAGRRLKGKVLKAATDTGGYLYVVLCKHGKQRNFSIHVLVAYEFCEGRSHELEVNHKDKNKSNNSYSNLEWMTHADNVIHSSAKEFRLISPEGELVLGRNVTAFAKEHNLSRSGLYHVLKSRTKSHKNWTLA